MALCRRVIKPNTSLVAAATSSVASSEAGYNAFSSLAGRSLGSHGVGRGCGVGLGLGIGVPLGVGLGGGVAVGVGVAVAVAVGVGVTEGVTVAVGVAVGVGVGLAERTLSTSTKRATVCWFPWPVVCTPVTRKPPTFLLVTTAPRAGNWTVPAKTFIASPSSPPSEDRSCTQTVLEFVSVHLTR